MTTLQGVDAMKSNYLSVVLALAACSVVPDALAATAHSGDLFVDAKFAHGSAADESGARSKRHWMRWGFRPEAEPFETQ